MSPFLASGLVKSASCGAEGTSGAFCQLKCFSTVHTPPAVPALRSCAPVPVWRSICGALAGTQGPARAPAATTAATQLRSARGLAKRTGSVGRRHLPRALRRNVGRSECRGGALGASCARGAAKLHASLRATAGPAHACWPPHRRRAARAHCAASRLAWRGRRQCYASQPQCAAVRSPWGCGGRERRRRRWRAAVSLAARFQVRHHTHQWHQPGSGDAGARSHCASASSPHQSSGSAAAKTLEPC